MEMGPGTGTKPGTETNIINSVHLFAFWQTAQ